MKFDVVTEVSVYYLSGI